MILRIVSDVHYGDRASMVTAFRQLAPLTVGVDRLVFNGDTLDTRPGPLPLHTENCQREVREFARAADAAVTFLTGNHDPDFSTEHALDVAEGEVFVVHGDVLFDDIVPWGRDARIIRHKLAELSGNATTAALARMPLDERFRLWRTVAAAIPQRHQSERRLWKYAVHFALDTVWPPDRTLKILRAWRDEPRLASRLAQQHRPKSKFMVLGHTHRPAIRRGTDGRIFINTGSYTGIGGYAVDVAPGVLRVRKIVRRSGEFFVGDLVAEFPLSQ